MKADEQSKNSSITVLFFLHGRPNQEIIVYSFFPSSTGVSCTGFNKYGVESEKPKFLRKLLMKYSRVTTF